MRAVASGALDRAVDVAATLEVRGYGSARRPQRARRPWSRHDVAFAASAVALVAVAVLAPVTFSAAPEFSAPVDAGALGTCAALAACILLPFADRRGIAR